MGLGYHAEQWEGEGKGGVVWCHSLDSSHCEILCKARANGKCARECVAYFAAAF